MVFILFMMTALCLAEATAEAVNRFVQWLRLPRYRWPRGGRFTFN